ncbi:hypothetical protein PoB_005094500 [Plakobranchus ocellatus]|uniref:Uncharacterized protein n=1 Tax=Plakobranchus ocellatus TaxID=259542 RepID=A0AAV4BYP7_9GAST|nr:hypothetical protein PoB_005094500 [Plakobranchus ocellatus]
MPPNPIGTRWNCWYDSVKYHLDHMEECKYSNFIESEMEHARSLAPISLKELSQSQFFAVEENVQNVKAHMKFITEKSEVFVDATALFQSQSPMATSVDSWIATLVPEVSYLTGAPTHFVNLVESAYHRCARLNAEKREGWLCLGVDLDFVSDAMSAVGITRKSFLMPPSDNHSSPVFISNRLVIDMEQFRLSQNLLKKNVIQWLHRLGGLDFKCLPRAIDSCVKTYEKLQKNKHRCQEEFVNFLNGQFKCAVGCDSNSGATAVKETLCKINSNPVWSMLKSIENAFDAGGVTMREMEKYCSEDTPMAQKKREYRHFQPGIFFGGIEA